MAKKLQILRNSTLFSNREEAISKLQDQLQTLSDGELCLARYQDGEDVNTIMGVAATNDSKTSYTIFDSDSVPADVQIKLTALQTGTGLSEEYAYVKDETADSLIGTATSLADADVMLAAALKQEIADRQTAITNLKKEDDAVTGQVVKAVSETDGVITVNRDFLVDTDVQIVAADASELETLGSEVKEAYKLINGNSVKLGSYIKIYKDQTLKEIKLVNSWYEKDGKTVPAETEGATAKTGQGLQYVYYLSNGETEIVTVDVSTFLVQSEFKSGLEVNTNGEVSIKIDETSEKVQIQDAEGENDGTAAVLSVGEDGVKVSNIQAAINYAVTSKNADAEGDDYVAASAANNKVTIESNVVKMSDVAAETKALADVKDVKDYVDTATAKATTVVSGEDASSGPAVKVTVDNTATDGHIEYKVAGQDLASNAELTNVETAVGLESNGTLAAISDKNYINGQTSVMDAVVSLDSALKTADDAMLINVASGSGISVTDKADKSQTISAVAVVDDPIVEVTENGIASKADAVWDCGLYE